REFDGLRYPNLAPHKLRDPLGRIAAADLFSDVGVSGLVGLDHADPGMGADVGGVGGHAAVSPSIRSVKLFGGFGTFGSTSGGARSGHRAGTCMRPASLAR